MLNQSATILESGIDFTENISITGMNPQSMFWKLI